MRGDRYSVHWATERFPSWQVDSHQRTLGEAIEAAAELAQRAPGVRLQVVDDHGLIVWPRPRPAAATRSRREPRGKG